MNALITLLLICGLIFFTGGTLGILRFPDFYSRLHPAGKLDTFGLVTTVGALALYIAFSQGSFLATLKISLIIVFVFITNLRFLDMISSAVLVDMDEQMKELGEFLLLMAKERAEEMGVRAYTEVRSGSIHKALIDMIRQYDADLVVMGQPGRSGNLFNREHMQDISDYLSEETGVEVMLV